MTCILQQQKEERDSNAIKVVSAVCDSDKGNSFLSLPLSLTLTQKGNRSPTLLRKTNSDREGDTKYEVYCYGTYWA